MRDCRPWARCTAWGGWSTWRAGLKTKHQQPFNYVQYNPEIVVRAKLNLINYLQQKSEIVVMAQLKPFNNSRQNYVIAVMAKLQHFKYFTSIHELSSWQGFFYFWHIPGTDSKILPQYMNYHHDTRFLFLLFSRNRFKVAMRPYDVREVVESFGAGQVKDSKNIWKCDHCELFWIAFKWIIKTHQVRLRCC